MAIIAAFLRKEKKKVFIAVRTGMGKRNLAAYYVTLEAAMATKEGVTKF